MTTDYRTMEAGRELDRLIAERLGWTDVTQHHLLIDVLIGKHPKETSHAWSPLMVPNYSNDINVAIMLVVKLRWRVDYHPETNDAHTNHYHVEIWTKNDWQDKFYYGAAITLPVAICRAWLAWKDSQP